jgi:Lon protease-like protein
MIHHSIKTNTPIGVVMVDRSDLANSGNSRGSIYVAHKKVCGVGMPVAIEETPEGYLKVIIRGNTRAYLEQLYQNLPFPIFTATVFEDQKQHAYFEQGQIERLSMILNNWIDETLIDSLERENFKQNIQTIHSIVDYTSMFLINDAGMRQKLLESNSLNQRITILNTLLHGSLPTEEDTNILQAFNEFHDLENNGQIAQ